MTLCVYVTSIDSRLEEFYYPFQLNVLDMLSWGQMEQDVVDAASQTAAVKTYKVSCCY